MGKKQRQKQNILPRSPISISSSRSTNSSSTLSIPAIPSLNEILSPTLLMSENERLKQQLLESQEEIAKYKDISSKLYSVYCYGELPRWHLIQRVIQHRVIRDAELANL